MKLIYLLYYVTIFPIVGYSQQITLLTGLQDTVKDSSGLIYFNQKLITHNDSGGEPALYELDSITGNTTRKVIISNATNIDWEDICYDNTYIYIGDFENNDGSRTDLKIYRISRSDYFTTVNDTVTADIIHFNYANQTDFTPGLFSTNFDAEALISHNDSLNIFTKNWGDNRTNIYALPKIPGTYQIEKIDSIDSQGLVTGATFNTVSNTLLLTGYTLVSPFIVEINDFTFSDFSSGTIKRYAIQPPVGYSLQIESITYINQNQYYLTAEESVTGNSALYRLNIADVLGLESIEKITGFIYPNPASDILNIKYNNLLTVEIYDLLGVLQKITTDKQIHISNLSKGIYIIVIKNSKGDKAVTKKLIIK